MLCIYLSSSTHSFEHAKMRTFIFVIVWSSQLLGSDGEACIGIVRVRRVLIRYSFQIWSNIP